MLIYLPKNENRSQYLVANSISKEFNGDLRSFNTQDIYEITFNNPNANIVILNEFNVKDVFISNFLTDFENYSKPHKTKIIILSEHRAYKNKNISYIGSSIYKLFNEYYTPTNIDNNYKFILCHLDCVNHTNNEKIQPIIYPANNTIPVKLVGCPNIQHPQNLGLVDDDQMIRLIQECAVYVDISHQYFYDAIWHNKPVVTIHKNEFVEPVTDLTISHIQDAINNPPITDHDLKKQRISNIIKYIIKL